MKFILSLSILFFSTLAVSATNQINQNSMIVTTGDDYMASAKSDTLILNADQGRFKFKPMRQESDRVNLSLQIKMLDAYTGTKWAPSAFAGLITDATRQNQFQLVVSDRNAIDGKLTISYKLIKNGKALQSKIITQIKQEDMLDVQLGFNQGQVEVSINDRPSVMVETGFEQVDAYVASSSSKSQFIIHKS